ncbi:MAG: hypothetical protein GQ554_02090 [Deltaproteobacteria bacterium]|nr:hypothetical protein [Deltaproteobacteria bacterium]
MTITHYSITPRLNSLAGQAAKPRFHAIDKKCPFDERPILSVYYMICGMLQYGY